MRGTLLFIAGCIGCGGSTAESLADIGWRFNYRDWTRPNCAESATSDCTDDDLRDCDNAPTTNSGPAYPTLASVRVLIKDPLGQVAPFDQTFECARGSGGQRIAVRGIARQVYDLNVSALTAAGDVLYQFNESGFDLSSKRIEDLELKAVTGELHFSPAFAGTNSGLCAPDVTTIRYTMLDGDAAAVLSGEQSACDDGFAAELYIRGVPSIPSQSQIGGYTPVQYTSKLEGLDGSGNVQYCSTKERNVSPGNNNFTDNQSLSAGECL